MCCCLKADQNSRSGADQNDQSALTKNCRPVLDPKRSIGTEKNVRSVLTTTVDLCRYAQYIYFSSSVVFHPHPPPPLSSSRYAHLFFNLFCLFYSAMATPLAAYGRRTHPWLCLLPLPPTHTLYTSTLL